MLSKILSSTVIGIDGYSINVEVDLSNGFPAFEIVGLPGSAVKESKERVRTAIKNAGFSIPAQRITINLSPADIRKEGPSFDLPIALGLLVCMGIVNQKKMDDIMVVGELSLDGNINSVSGVLPMVFNSYKKGIIKYIVPYSNADEAALVDGVNIYPAKSLSQIISFLNGKEPITVHKVNKEKLFGDADSQNISDFSDVKGQAYVKRAMEIAASGYHNIFMLGSNLMVLFCFVFMRFLVFAYT